MGMRPPRGGQPHIYVAGPCVHATLACGTCALKRGLTRPFNARVRALNGRGHLFQILKFETDILQLHDRRKMYFVYQ